MTLVSFLSNIRNAAIMNAVIVIFHIWVAIAIEGLGFLGIVLPIGALVAAAYYFKGKIGEIKWEKESITQQFIYCLLEQTL